MNSIIWKAFTLGSLLDRSTKLAMGANQKDLNLVDEKDDSHTIALISASRSGSGRVGYIETDLVDASKVSINKLTFDDQWGFTFFQQEDFVITGGHNAILEIIDEKFKNLLDKNLSCYSFLSLIINNITIKTGIYGYGYKINNKLDREIIILPCLEVAEGEDYIWEEDGKHYTLAVDYIKKLMDEAKELREQKTIRLYEAERKKYEAERKKYEAERKKFERQYKNDRKVLVWKSFKLKELFETSTEHYLNKSKKNYNISEVKTDEFPVAVCAASSKNNGIVGYIAEVDDVPIKKRKGYLTKGGFGHFFYQDDWFIKPGGSWGMLDIVKIKDEKLKAALDSEVLTYKWIAKILTKMFTPMSSFGYSIPFDREIIILPCLEVAEGEDYIWEEDGKHYTLAANYISYLYLTGRVNYNQKLIDNYTYQY